MTDLITTDEVLFDDIVGLLDFSAPLTPRVFAGELTDPTVAFSEGFATAVVARDAATNPIDGINTNRPVRGHKREMEKNRQRRYRQKLKSDRDELQQEVDELSKELHQLIEQKSRRKQLKASYKTLLMSNSQWASVANRHRLQQIHSEEERKELVAAFNQQTEYVKVLRQVAGDVPCFPDIPTLRPMATSLYSTYLQQLQDCYARVGRVMDFYNMETLPETTRNSVQRRQEDGGVDFFNHLFKMALPYTFNQTCDALGKAIHELGDPPFRDYETAPDIDVYIKSRVLRSLDGGQLLQRYISRFYREEERLVIVWKTSSEGEGAFSGLHAEETAWACVRPTATGVMLEVCVQQAPMQFNYNPNKGPAVTKFHTLLQESLEADRKKIVKVLERVLLDGILTGIEC